MHFSATLTGAITASIALSACSNPSDWETRTKKDEMTDNEIHYLSGRTTEEITVPATPFRKEEKFRPWFQLKLTPGEGYFLQYVTWPPQMDYGQGAKLTVRFDDKPAVDFLVRAKKPGGDVLTIVQANQFLRRMRAAEKTMLLQYETSSGKQVLRYSLSTFKKQLDTLCLDYPKECGDLSVAGIK